MPAAREGSLGIHLGHDASCSVVRNGNFDAAIQLERTTRVKHVVAHKLANSLPVSQVIGAAATRIDALENIVSSFQAASPTGFGFDGPTHEPDFDLFDICDPRHLVISHHLAHAMSAVGLSGLDEAAVLVCDLAGSTTIDGADYSMPYSDWLQVSQRTNSDQSVLTECLSIYHWKSGHLSLVDREFVAPHNKPDEFVFSEASLYQNATFAVFNGRPAYGELMALSAYCDGSQNADISQIVEITDDGVGWKNGWQNQFRSLGSDLQEAARLARDVQHALNEALDFRVRRAVRLTGCRNLAVAGGVFLNIIANSRIFGSGSVDQLYVPSCPHDAGISAGCAYYGQSIVGKSTFHPVFDDRLGPEFDQASYCRSLDVHSAFVKSRNVTPPEVARLLFDGAIIARFSGRAEFGPRALGGRSLLASPLIDVTKSKLNSIKGRQSWRPVAPIVLDRLMEQYFTGPSHSPFMNFVHEVRPEYRDTLVALAHPDNTTRAQSLSENSDEFLYQTIKNFCDLTGFGVLANTSFNGKHEPIVHHPDEAISFFLTIKEVDYLLLGDNLVERCEPWVDNSLLTSRLQLNPEAFLHQVWNDRKAVQRIWFRAKEIAVAPEIFTILSNLGSFEDVGEILETLGGSGSAAANDLYILLVQGALILEPV